MDVVGNLFKNTKFLLQNIKVRNNLVYFKVQEYLENNWSGLKPIIVKCDPQESKTHFVIHLPPTIPFPEFKRREDHISDFLNGAAQIEKRGSVVTLTVLTEPLKPRYPYSIEFLEKYKEMCLPVCFGYSAGGLVVEDLAEIVNLLIAGHPKSGKSSFLHTLVATLYAYRDIDLHVFDLKRGVEFPYLESRGVTIMNPQHAQLTFFKINEEIDRRYDRFKAVRVTKLQDYIELGYDDIKFGVIVIDEAKELKGKDTLAALNRIAAYGRAAGYCVVLATHRPSATMFESHSVGDIKALFPGSMCFHVRDATNSGIVLGEGNAKAAYMPNIPGRAIYQYDKELEVQTMWLSSRDAENLINNVKGGVISVNQSSKVLPPR